MRFQSPAAALYCPVRSQTGHFAPALTRSCLSLAVADSPPQQVIPGMTVTGFKHISLASAQKSVSLQMQLTSKAPRTNTSHSAKPPRPPASEALTSGFRSCRTRGVLLRLTKEHCPRWLHSSLWVLCLRSTLLHFSCLQFRFAVAACRLSAYRRVSNQMSVSHVLTPPESSFKKQDWGETALPCPVRGQM